LKNLIPAGRYLAQLVRRNTSPPEPGGGVEFTFRVALGEYEGELVSMRLWATGRIGRADRLSSRDTVEIVVGHRVAKSGTRFATVHDFRKRESRTAIDSVRGEDEATPEKTRADKTAARGTFRPRSLITESDLEDVADSLDEDGGEADPVARPYIDDGVVKEVNAAARDFFDEPLHAVEDPPDECDADEDAAEHVWVVTRVGDERPAATRLEDEQQPPPLSAAQNGAKGPIQCSLFEYRSDLSSYMAAHRQSVRGYTGVAWSRWLPVRLLSEDGLDAIYERARLIARACVSLGVPREQVVAVNSWNCGLTLLIPSGAANAVAQVGYEKVAGHFAQYLTDFACMHTLGVPTETTVFGAVVPKDRTIHARIDRQLYGPVAVHPMLNSPDERGKCFAVALSYEELMSQEVKSLEGLAKAPRPIPRPTWRANPVGELESLWDYAVEVEGVCSKRYDRLSPDDSFVYADTFDWMLHGSDMETAAKRLFRAAVNLLRVGCSPDAVVALLHPAAHLSGLDRANVRWGVGNAAKSLVCEGFYLYDGQW
jgi:hypothetical protein